MTEKYEAKLPGTAITVQDPKLVHKIADLLCIPLEAAANLTASVVRVVHLPIAALETYGNRVVRMIANAEAQVPPARQIPPAPSIAGPILENVKYLEEGNPLAKLYENLLARAIDRDRVNEAHPAFADLIKQLSPDEGLLLYHVSRAPLVQKRQYRHYPGKDPAIRNHVVVSTWAKFAYLFPQHERMYLSRLELLGLLTSESRTESIGADRDSEGFTFTTREITMTAALSDFGKLFADACIPDRWETGQPSSQ